MVDVLLGIARLLLSGMTYLLVGKWRATFPIHVLIAMGLMALIINKFVSEGSIAVLVVAFVAIIIVQLVRTGAPRRENRLFGYVAAGAGSAWVLSTRFLPVPGEYLTIAAGALLVLFALIWSMDYRQATVTKLDDETKSFTLNPERQARAKTKDVEVIERIEEPDFGWTAIWTWPGNANSVNSMIENTRAIETELGEQEGALSIERIFDQQTHRAYSNRVQVTCVRVNPLITSVPWDVRPATRPDEVKQLATYDDTKALSYQLWTSGIGGTHMLVAGAPGAGKSHLLQLLALMFGPNDWVRMILVDFKGGTAFRPMAALGSWLVTNLVEAVAMLELLLLECDRRAHYVAEQGWKNGVWKPSGEHPIIVAFFDEISSLTGKGAGADPKERTRIKFMLAQLAQKGRAVGIILIVGVQEPTTESLGSTQFINMFGLRIAFRLNVKGRAQYCIPGLAGQVEPQTIPETLRGTAYVDTGGVGARARQARFREIPEWAPNKIVSEFWSASLSNQTREIEGFSIPTLPAGATLTEDRLAMVQDIYLHRERHRPQGSSSHYEPDSSQPRIDMNKPAIDREPRETIDHVRRDDGRRQLDPSSDDHRSARDLVAEAEKHPNNSRAGSELRTEAVRLLLHENPGGLARKAIGDVVNRKGSWVSASLADLERAGKVHRVGEIGNALWYPGPIPDDDSDDDDSDPDEETED